MLFMVTNRRINNGEYGDEERAGKKFDYQYDYSSSDGVFTKAGRRGFEQTLMAELSRLKASGVNTPKVGIYIHGYNTNYRESVDVVHELEQKLGSDELCGYRPVIVGFSWPSSGKASMYLSDREEIRDSVGAFTRFLLALNELVTRNARTCFSTSFCIAHSMGNYLLRKGMEYLSDDLGSPMGRMLFDETVMIAPDLASGDIELDGKGRYIADFSRRVHVYYSKHDRALKASSVKRFGGDRLGRHGIDDYYNLRGNIVGVNAGNYANTTVLKGLEDSHGEQVSVHSAYRYQQNILMDILQVISSIDREQIIGRQAYSDEGGELHNHYLIK